MGFLDTPQHEIKNEKQNTNILLLISAEFGLHSVSSLKQSTDEQVFHTNTLF
jgi:hypothetical protein